MTKKFNLPVIMMGGLDPDPEDPSIIGGGTGSGTTNPYPCSFNDWMNDFGEDFTGDSLINWEDYGKWWADGGLTQEQWLGIGNTALEWTTYVAPYLD